MMADFYAHYYAENPGKVEDEDDSFDKDAILRAMEEHPDDWETIIQSGTQ